MANNELLRIDCGYLNGWNLIYLKVVLRSVFWCSLGKGC